MSDREPIRLATRGSDLALRQAAEVKAALEDRRFDVELVEVETEGDRVTDEQIHNLGKTGAFVRALDQRILDGEVDAAVHSMKDVPTEQPDELETAAVPRRASAGDALVTRDGTAPEDLPEGAVVGTASLRRRAQLLSRRPDLHVEPVRGNVDTRLEKLLAPALQAEHERRLEASEEEASQDAREQKNEEYEGDAREEPEFERSVEEWFDDLNELERKALERDVETEFDAVVLAKAGLERSGLAHQVELVDLPTDEHVPAPGQGALAIVASDDDVVETLNEALDHPRSRVETTVERIVLEELGGGCIAPIGVHGFVQGESVNAQVQVFDRDGETTVSETRQLDVEDYAEEARELAADLADRGARDLIEEARKEA
ncbi:hydroxymethylbilane synthase [Halospeciosus flavus]|uniref:Hydroxymethylbilane synthase n=1 Tax=Halospeciosus flavus TaxID=3032283 RepID=A0ABD5Z731_9EURY|nr:hydroxymethylbilane synthase [Halospeciosus flavus]